MQQSLWFDARFALTDRELESAKAGEPDGPHVPALERMAATLEAISRLRETYRPEELRDALCLDNCEMKGDRLRGGVLIFAPDAPVRDPDQLFDPRWHGVVSVSRVEGVTAETEARFSRLVGSMRTEAERPYSLSRQVAEDGIDAEPWTASLGGSSGYFVSLSKEEEERAEPTYWLVCHTGSGRAGQELQAFIRSRAGITFAEVLDSREYQMARHHSLRNNHRVMAEAADLLELDLATEDDAFARPGRHRPPPKVAAPQIVCEYNRLARVTVSGRPSIAYYSHCTALDSCRGAAISLVDPIAGCVVYRGASDGSDGRGPFSNGAAGAFPIGTGRLIGDDAERARSALDKDPKRKAFASRIAAWKGKADKDVGNDRLSRYSELTPRKAELRTTALGASLGHTRLKPVHVLIPSPDAARPKATEAALAPRPSTTK